MREKSIKPKNAEKTCWNCPAARFKGKVDFRSCGQTKEELKRRVAEDPDFELVIECGRRPELGLYEPTITFEQCPQWEETRYGYLLKDMRVMILGIDGYLGWPLALKLSRLGCKVSGVDNYTRRRAAAEKGHGSVVPIYSMEERLRAAKEILDVDIDFQEIDINNREALKTYIETTKPEAIIHYGEIPSAPYSMVDAEHAIEVQRNNVLGTLGLLHLMRDVVPETCLIKLGTMGEYGSPLTGRPLFEGLFPADAILQWDNREWSLGGELTPRDPVSFYHVSKVQDTYNIYEACKYWWLRSYDVMQGVIFGVYTEEVAMDPRLRTRLDIDEWFGTVVNRFVAQAILGIPLTVYGEGNQIRGMIGLNDAMQCMVRLLASPPEAGQYDVVNQISGVYRIRDIAEIVAHVAREEFDIDVEIQRLENPRAEADRHPLEVVSQKLPREFGFHSRISIKDEVRRMFNLLLQDEARKKLEKQKNVIMPETQWSGEKRQPEVLEKYRPGTNHEETGMKQKMIT